MFIKYFLILGCLYSTHLSFSMEPKGQKNISKGNKGTIDEATLDKYTNAFKTACKEILKSNSFFQNDIKLLEKDKNLMLLVNEINSKKEFKGEELSSLEKGILQQNANLSQQIREKVGDIGERYEDSVELVWDLVGGQKKTGKPYEEDNSFKAALKELKTAQQMSEELKTKISNKALLMVFSDLLWIRNNQQ